MKNLFSVLSLVLFASFAVTASAPAPTPAPAPAAPHDDHKTPEQIAAEKAAADKAAADAKTKH